MLFQLFSEFKRFFSSHKLMKSQLNSELAKLQEKEELLTARLLELQKKKQEYESKQVMEAFRKSGKSLQELMTFLDV